MSLAAILKVGLPVLVQGIGEALKNVNHPAAQGAATALEGLNEAMTKGQITPEQMTEMNRHLEKMEELEAQERQNSIQQINESLRAEVASTDPYVRRMRPTFGYMIATTWAAQMFGLAYVIVFETAEAPMIIHAMDSLATIWAVGLSVLGIYVYKRSEEKRPIYEARPVAEKTKLLEKNVVKAPVQQPKYNP